jgi:hypothetical protein
MDKWTVNRGFFEKTPFVYPTTRIELCTTAEKSNCRGKRIYWFNALEKHLNQVSINFINKTWEYFYSPFLSNFHFLENVTTCTFGQSTEHMGML